MATLNFTSVIEGLPIVAAKLAAFRAGIVGYLGTRRIQKYLVKRTQLRFEPRGSNPVAQREPSGRMWKFASLARARDRRRSHSTRSRALYDTGALQKSIVVTKKAPMMNIITSTGGSFSIGVKKNSKAYKYAAVMQNGGRNSRGVVIPARPFIGVGKQEAEELGVMGQTVIGGDS